MEPIKARGLLLECQGVGRRFAILNGLHPLRGNRAPVASDFSTGLIGRTVRRYYVLGYDISPRIGAMKLM